MTIEIADRLIQLRKKNGYSQEELADKLGLSRQAVSKWERAEASPDTDNLICLAKLYGVSLDELLSTDEDIDTIVKEQVKDKEEPEKEGKAQEEEQKDEVHVGFKGIHIKDKDGSSVDVSFKGIHIVDKDDCRCSKEHKKPTKFSIIISSIESALWILAIVAYLLLGSLAHMWHNAWIVFFVPEIVCSLARAFYHKKANKFNIAFAACFAFFFVCMVIPGLDSNLWHPMWVVFLSIPLYHTIASIAERAKKVGDDAIDVKVVNCKDNDDDDDDEDDD